jgi:hypothetical protein
MAPWRIFMNKLILRQEVFRKTQDLINQHGPRLAGTESDLHAADTLYEDMKSFADHAHQDDFFIHQGAFLGWIRILVFQLYIRNHTALVWLLLDHCTTCIRFCDDFIHSIHLIQTDA